jgi:AcrR family transcriptional regulator
MRLKPLPVHRSADDPVDDEFDRRADLLDAAINLIAEKGIEGLRTREIVARAGLNISMLHYYFKTKETLLLAVLRRVMETLKPSLPPDPVGQYAQEELHEQFAAAFRSFRDRPQLATVLQEMRLRCGRDATTRKAFSAMHAEWNQGIEEILRTGIAAGQIRPDLDPHCGAVALTSFIMGSTMQLWVNPKAFNGAAVSKEFERWLSGKPSAVKSVYPV